MPLVKASHLQQWANSDDGRNRFGELIYRLIFAGVKHDSLKYIRFLSNESNNLPGWDGELSCIVNNTWIPDGNSVWEISVEDKPRAKIISDFKKRKKMPIKKGWKYNETTYILATLRKFAKNTELENELKNNSPWKDVKIYDSIIFEHWIQQYLGVETWLREQNVGPKASISTLENFWNNWSNTTIPSISSKLLIADREQDAAKLIENIKNNSQHKIILQTDSPEESLAFLYSSISECDIEFKNNYLSKGIVINKTEDIEILKTMPPHNIILVPPVTENFHLLINHSHSVIIATGNSSNSFKKDFCIKRPIKSKFQEALISMGIRKDKAEIDATASGSSSSIWRIWNIYENAELSIKNLPEWSTNEDHIKYILPAILIGGWCDKFKGDQSIIHNITGIKYDDYLDEITKYLYFDNPPLQKIDDIWLATAPTVSFALLIKFINTGHFKKLSAIFKKVFSEIDPTLDLRPEERHLASIKNKIMKYSTLLRDGLAGTLLRLVVLGSKLEKMSILPNNQKCQEYVNFLIKDLPGLSDDSRLLISLREQLPVLAEAAPRPFIEALERLLQGNRDNILPIFDEGDSFYGQSYLPNILWALETLAWDPELLPRVSVILAGLSEIDPGGKLGNRPINSLREIFLAWHSGTSATLNIRSQTIDLIIKTYPDIGWNLLKGLMPSNHQISSGTRKPEWKDFGRSQIEPITRSSLWKTYDEYIRKLINISGINPKRWKEIIEFYDDFSNEHQQLVEDGLNKLSRTVLSEGEKHEIWDELRNFINKHRSYSGAVWSLPEEKLNRLDTILNLFSPSKYTESISWLFDDHFPDIPFSKINNLEESRKELDKLRNNAVKNILGNDSGNDLIDLIDKVSYPYLIAFHVIENIEDEKSIFNIFKVTNDSISKKQNNFAKTLSEKAYKKFGEHWINLIKSEYVGHEKSIEAIVNSIELFPDSLEVYNFISSLGIEVENKYWVTKYTMIYSESEIIIKYAINKFIEARRNVEIVSNIHDKLISLGPEIVIKVMDLSLEELSSGDPNVNMSNYGYCIKQLTKWLRKQDSVDKSEIARREYSFLPLFTSYGIEENLILHEFMSTEPDFFVDVLCDLFRPSDEIGDEFKPSEIQKQRAKSAWDLLRTWKKIPGIDKDGNINNEELNKWVCSVLKLAEQKKRLKSAYNYIGQVFSHAPSDPTDSVWPHIAVRNLIEELKNEDLESGIEIEQFNSRGVVTKNMFEGGKQEYDLAQKWREWQKNIDIKWLRTKKMLGRIADSWEKEAKREDIDAEKQKLLYS